MSIIKCLPYLTTSNKWNLKRNNKREWLYINDTVTQYDQGTSIIETTSLSNNSKFVDYNSAYLSVPLLITLRSNVPTYTSISTAKPYMEAVSFKQSFYLWLTQSPLIKTDNQWYNKINLLTYTIILDFWSLNVGHHRTDGAPLHFILMLLMLLVLILPIISMPLLILFLITALILD